MLSFLSSTVGPKGPPPPPTRSPLPPRAAGASPGDRRGAGCAAEFAGTGRAQWGGRTFSSPGRFNGLPIGKPKPLRPKTWSASQPYRGRALSRADQLRPRVASPTAGPSRYNHRLGRFQPWGSQHDTPWLFPGTTHARGITFLLPSVVAGRPAVYPQAPFKAPHSVPQGGSQFPTAPPDVRDRLYGHLQIASLSSSASV